MRASLLYTFGRDAVLFAFSRFYHTPHLYTEVFLVGRSCRVRLPALSLIRIADRASPRSFTKFYQRFHPYRPDGVDKDGPSHRDCACLSDGRTRQEQPTNSKSALYAQWFSAEPFFPGVFQQVQNSRFLRNSIGKPIGFRYPEPNRKHKAPTTFSNRGQDESPALKRYRLSCVCCWHCWNVRMGISGDAN